MNLLLRCFPTATNTIPLRYLLFVTGVIVVGLLICLTVEDFAEGREGVKIILLVDEWLIGDERYSNSGSNAPKRGRNVSITYETLRTGDNFSGEDFQNMGTSIVVRSSVFSVSSARKTHLARDAYNAWQVVSSRSQNKISLYA